MKSQRISSNIYKVLQMIRRYKDQDQEGLIISVDFQKCFNQIESEAIYGALEFFGFGKKFVSNIKTMYSNISACIQNNGNFSQPFDIYRGVQQGPPNSSYIFLLCAEIMVIMIRNTVQIKGLPVKDIMYLLSQYEDDFNTFSHPMKESVGAIFNVLSEFQVHQDFR